MRGVRHASCAGLTRASTPTQPSPASGGGIKGGGDCRVLALRARPAMTKLIGLVLALLLAACILAVLKGDKLL